MLDSLKDVMYVKVYLTVRCLPTWSGFAAPRRTCWTRCVCATPESIQYSFIDPSESDDEKTRKEVYDQLQEQGLELQQHPRCGRRETYSERIVFPGAMITYRDKTMPVQLLKTQLRTPDADIVNRSINNLEYEMASAFRQVTSTGQARIAFLEGHGELEAMEVMDVTKALEELYDVNRVRIDDRIDALSQKVDGVSYRVNDYEALVIAKPDSVFSDRDRYVIDQFVMNGGRVLWLVDAMNANLDSLRRNQFSIAVPY